MMYTGYIRENDANRIAAAQLVQQFLTSKAFKYSKNPPSTGGKDVVENFLSNSRQGFCVHFASAGTMILRQMGVPCRYVSGYCAKEDSFKSGENDEDICEVKDSQSHAWVEIYLDDFGWIPVEMTPGYFEYVTGENPFDYIGVNGKKTNTGAAYNDSEHMNDTAADEDAANEDIKIQMQKMMTQQKMIHQKLQQTVHQVMAVRRLMVHSQVRINVQMLRTQKETSYTTGDFKNLTLCDFSDCTYSHHSLYQKAKKYFVGSKTCKKGEKRPLQQGSNNDKQPHLQRSGTSFKEQDR